VVIISDACRSTPQSIQAERVRGSLIFPNETVSRDARPDVDRFFATLPGDPALEMSVEDSVKQHKGIFTHCFLQAYIKPDPEMVRQVPVDSTALQVVSNRSLKEYLRREVPTALRRRKLVVGQLPDAVVESGDSVSMGRVAPDGVTTSRRRQRGSIDVGDVAQLALAHAMGTPADFPKSVSDAVAAAAGQSGFDASVNVVNHAQRTGSGHFETMADFKVFGAGVAEVIGLNMGAEVWARETPLDPSMCDSTLVQFPTGMHRMGQVLHSALMTDQVRSWLVSRTTSAR